MALHMLAFSSANVEIHMVSPDYLSTKQASERYGLSESWLTKLRVFGTGPEHLKVGRRVLYERSRFEGWLNQHRRTSTSESVGGSELARNVARASETTES